MKNPGAANRNWEGRDFGALARPTPPLDDEAAPEILTTEPDDATTAYVLATRGAFESLRQAASQLAGLMVLAAAGARGGPGHPMLERAREGQATAHEAIRAALVPARGRHHHRHLVRAAKALGAALEAATLNIHRREDAAMDAILVPLRFAHLELRRAAFALPGFEIVALSQGCCGAHDGRRSEAPMFVAR